MGLKPLFNHKLRVKNNLDFDKWSLSGNEVCLSDSSDQFNIRNSFNDALSIQSFDKTRSSKYEILDSNGSTGRIKEIAQENFYSTIKENCISKFTSSPIGDIKVDQIKDKMGNFMRQQNFKYQKNFK